jgi:MFS transporter, FSR family, fosmidomycin resistance protein
LGALAAGHFAVDCCVGIWPVYKTIAGLDLVKAGAIATAGSMIGNGTQIAFGVLADRGLARTLLVGGVLLAGSVTLVSYTSSYPLLFLLVLAAAIGSAAFHPCGTGAAGALSRERTGVLVALFLAGGSVGYSLSQLLFTATYRATHGATAVLLPIPLIAAVALYRLAPVPVPDGRARRSWISSVRGALRPLSALFAVQMFAAAINISLVFLLPDLLRARGYDAWLVEGGGHFALVLGGCLALVPAGHAADRFGARRVLLITNVLTGILLAAVLRLDLPPLSLLLLVAGFGAFNGVNNVVVVAEGNRMLPGQNSGVSALLMGMPWCIAALASVISGTLADPARGGHPAAALTWMAVCIPATLCSSMFVQPRRPPRACVYGAES